MSSLSGFGTSSALGSSVINELEVTDDIKTGRICADDGSDLAPPYSFKSDKTTGMLLSGSGNLGFTKAGVRKFTVFSNTNQSAEDLQVVGGKKLKTDTIENNAATKSISLFPTVSISTPVSIGGVYTLPSADGTSGQAIVTDGLGSLSFSSMTSSFPLLAPDGSSSAPPYSFTNETGNGMFRPGAGQVAISAGGGTPTITTFKSGSIESKGRIEGPDGSAALPTYSFSSATGTGFSHLATSSHLQVSVAGSLTSRFDSDGLFMVTGKSIRSAPGSVSVPGVSFNNATDSGMYTPGSGQVALSAGGVQVLNTLSTSFQPKVQILSINGSADSPTYSFSGNSGLGFYRIGVDQLGIATGGIQRVNFQNTQSVFNTPVLTQSDTFSGGLHTVNKLYVETSGTTVVNTTTPTSVFSGGLGTRVFPANSLTAGSVISGELSGLFGTKSGTTGTLTFTLTVGGVATIFAHVFNPPSNVTNLRWDLVFTCVVTASGVSGSIRGFGDFSFHNGSNTKEGFVAGTSSAIINTTSSNTLNLTVEWSTADTSNVFTTNLATIRFSR